MLMEFLVLPPAFVLILTILLYPESVKSVSYYAVQDVHSKSNTHPMLFERDNVASISYVPIQIQSEILSGDGTRTSRDENGGTVDTDQSLPPAILSYPLANFGRTWPPPPVVPPRSYLMLTEASQAEFPSTDSPIDVPRPKNIKMSNQGKSRQNRNLPWSFKTTKQAKHRKNINGDEEFVKPLFPLFDFTKINSIETKGAFDDSELDSANKHQETRTQLQTTSKPGARSWKELIKFLGDVTGYKQKDIISFIQQQINEGHLHPHFPIKANQAITDTQDEQSFYGHSQEPPKQSFYLPEMQAPVFDEPTESYQHFCNKTLFPESLLKAIRMERTPKFVYGLNCSETFFQCANERTFPNICPSDQAFDPKIPGCNFKHSISTCPDFDYVMHCSIRENCTHDQFACCSRPQRCIELYRRCDGHMDCSDGDDENNCPSCGRSEFTCVKSGRCIASSKRCDGNVDDCQDGINLDEIGCLRNETCLGKFPCDSPQTVSALGHSTCVELHLFCDGKNDCPGGEDELTCSSYVDYGNNDEGDGPSRENNLKMSHFLSISPLYLSCENQKESILQHRWCNGLADCSDNSDEKHCF